MAGFPFFRRNGGPPRGRRKEDPLAVGRGNHFFLEKIRSLRAVVEQRSELHRLKVLGITSAVAGEGKTLTCAQLGMSLASTGRKKILLVDLDIRTAALSQGMGAHRSPGLTDYLQKGVTLAQLVQATAVPNLFLVSTGAEIASPADMLAGEAFKAFLADIRDRFDLILLDSPPVLPVADTTTVREQVDGFILVYRIGGTPHTLFRQALDELGEKHVLGAVLNGVEGMGSSYYEKYYGSYYQGKKSALAAGEPGGSTVSES